MSVLGYLLVFVAGGLCAVILMSIGYLTVKLKRHRSVGVMSSFISSIEDMSDNVAEANYYEDVYGVRLEPTPLEQVMRFGVSPRSAVRTQARNSDGWRGRDQVQARWNARKLERRTATTTAVGTSRRL